MPRRLPRRFFDRPPVVVAPELLGCTISHQGVTVRLTEVEAYAGAGDPGSHAFSGRPTARTATLFGPPGGLYVYFTYGMHYCANLVCGRPEQGGGVLLRAGEVIDGWPAARERRRSACRDRDLARGPACLASALGIGPAEDGLVVTDRASTVIVKAAGIVDVERVACGPRVGVSGPGGDGALYPWRFWLDQEPTVSAYRPAVPRRRVARG